MRKRLIEAGVGLLGLIVIALAVASATLWRADDVLVARGTGTAGLLVTDPGVLELGGDPVTVRATVPAGAKVVLAVGRDTDVTGWVGTDPYQRVSGLSGWRSLRLAAPAAPTASPAASSATSPSASAGTTQPAAPAASVPVATAPGATASAAPGSTAAPAADPSGSDMWVAQASGTGSATLVWHAQDGRWSLLVAGVGPDGSAVKPTLEMSWPRVVSAPWLAPGLVLGGLLLLAGAGSFGRDWWRARTGRDGWTSVETGAMPQVAPAGPAPVLTRRQLRELEGRGGRPPTGAVRTVVPSDVHTRAVDAVAAAPGPRAATAPPLGAPREPAPGGRPTAPAPGSRPVPFESAYGQRPPVQSSAPSSAPGRRPLDPAPGPGPRPLVAPAAPGRGGSTPAAPTPGGRFAPTTPPTWAASTPGPLTSEEAARHAAPARPTSPRGGPQRTPSPGGGVSASPTESSGAGTAPWSAAPAPQTERSAPSWAAGSRRATRSGAATPDDAPRPTGPATHAEPSRVAPPDHERRPAWAPAPGPVHGPSGTPWSAPASAQGLGRPHAEQQPPVPPTPAVRATQPPRPGGWVPVPDPAERSQPPSRGATSARPTAPAPGGPDTPSGHRAPGHPSWLQGSAQPGPVQADPMHAGPVQPGPAHHAASGPAAARPRAGWRASPGSGPTWSAPAAGPDEHPRTQDDDAEETLAARADAWRRAWGLPTEPPADERGGEGR